MAGTNLTFEEAHRRIKVGDLASIRQALDQGTSPNLTNQYGWSLLMIVALEGISTIGELLIERGANLDQINNSGETALSLAAHKGHLGFVRLLILSGSSVECRPHGHDLKHWLMMTSGLPEQRIFEILNAIDPKSTRIDMLVRCENVCKERR